MQFITFSRRIIERYSDADFAPRLEEGAQRARALYLEGFIRQIWHRGDMKGACILVEADSEEAVREKLWTLPLVAARMLEVTAIVPLKPYGGFGPRRIFRTDRPGPAAGAAVPVPCVVMPAREGPATLEAMRTRHERDYA